MERSETLVIMDRLEALVLRQGWPVPLTPFYLVDHEKMLTLMDQLRVSLQDEMDGRLIDAFAEGQTIERSRIYKHKGKESGH